MKKIFVFILSTLMLLVLNPSLEVNADDTNFSDLYSEYIKTVSFSDEAYILSEEEVVALNQMVEDSVREIEEETFNSLTEINLYQMMPMVKKENDYFLERLFFLNRNHAVQVRRKADEIQGSASNWAEGFAKSKYYKYTTFKELVKSGGAWDLKSNPLQVKSTYLWRNSYRTGEYIGNYHYGYMGVNIGIDKDVLKVAAGLYQIYSGTSELHYWRSYFDDPEDQRAIDHGISEWQLIF